MNENVLRKEICVQDEKWILGWPFENKDLLKNEKNIKLRSQEEVLNQLNHIHFIGGTVIVYLYSTHTLKKQLFRVKIHSCSETQLKCNWMVNSLSDIFPFQSEISHIAMDDGKNLTLLPVNVIQKNKHFFTVALPEMAFEIKQRQIKRHPCRQVHVQINQDSQIITGKLLDFSSFDCRIQMQTTSDRQLDGNINTHISFFKAKDLLYSGAYHFIRENEDTLLKEMVFKFNQNAEVECQPPNKLRNPRLSLKPAPSINYLHPIIQKRFHLEITNISSSGFCVFENADESVLMKNMVINNLIINFTDTFKIHCSVKVVYCLPETQGLIQCGIVILDMAIRDYNLLNKILVHSLDSHSNINNAVDMESLWEFFFNGNFIYPQKYHHIQSFRHELKNIYQSLYQETPSIANHFIYQKNGKIYGHISMLRAYEKCWLLHHHIAKVMDHKPVGFLLLKQMMHYFMDMHRLPSLKTDYIMACFRPENKFPNRIFGGYHQSAADSKKCSMDLFAYIESKKLYLFQHLPKEWQLKKSSADDIAVLHDYYEQHSGGLLLDAIGMQTNHTTHNGIEEEYQQVGLLRRLEFYTLCRYDTPCASIIVDQSNPGLNLADLVNSVKVIIMQPEFLSWTILSMAVNKLIRKHQIFRPPVLIYPFDYVIVNGISYKKRYQLWLFHAAYVRQFVDFLQKKFRISYWN